MNAIEITTASHRVIAGREKAAEVTFLEYGLANLCKTRVCKSMWSYLLLEYNKQLSIYNFINL